LDYSFWLIREANTAVYVANMPMLWALLKDLIPQLSSTRNSRSEEMEMKRARSSPGLWKKALKRKQSPSYTSADLMTLTDGSSREIEDMQLGAKGDMIDWRTDGRDLYAVHGVDNGFHAA
jgi:hypothetical protein